MNPNRSVDLMDDTTDKEKIKNYLHISNVEAQ